MFPMRIVDPERSRLSPAGMRCRPRRMEVRFTQLCLAAILSMASLAAMADSRLADAVERGDRARIGELLLGHVEVDVPQADGMTALHWAVFREDLETAERLLKARASVAATNHYGVTPLSIACENGNGALVELLLERGADPNTVLRGGESALMTAARTGRTGPVAALLKRGAEVNAKEHRGQTALMWAAAEGHAGVVELLLKAGADPGIALPDSGFSAFFLAAREGRGDVVRALLKAGIDVNGTLEPRRTGGKGPRKGTSALLLAVENGHFNLALDLVGAGADPNDQRSGFTPLHVMTWVRKPQRGEDEGDPAPQGSGNLGSLSFIRELVRRGADVNARLQGGKGGPGLYTMRGATPFLMASATADLACMKLLVELGGDPNVPNAERCTPLMVACGIGVGGAAANEVAGEEPEVLEAAQWLLTLGADVNAVDDNGETAMHGAALKNLPRVVQFLADHGARIEVWNRKNRYGWTPLVLAQGHRPGNFKPSFETIDAVQGLMTAAGLVPSDSPTVPVSGSGDPSAAWTKADPSDATASRRTLARDIAFARVDGKELKLDLHLPTGPRRGPLIVWVHGGAWRSGSKSGMPLGRLVEEGYAVASVDYRLSTEVRFPAQIHDLKAAIRFLRANGSRWQLPADPIVIAGDSAGAHLAALVGVSNGHPELEGTVGDDRGQRSEVQGIISFYGASDLTTILKQSTPVGLGVRVPALELLLGGHPTNTVPLARLASPVFHVDPSDPPLLLLHGDQDPQMPIQQSEQLNVAYRKAGAPVELEVVRGAVHGGSVFYDEERLARVRRFLERKF